VVSKEIIQKSPFEKDQPAPVQLTLTQNAQDRIEIISKLSTVKNINEYETITNMKVLEKNTVFVQAIE